MASTSEVPGKYDLVLAAGSTTTGYTFLRSKDGSNGSRAEYTSTPTFVERQNVGVAYGDDQQAFWQTFSQKDWSLGGGQKFAHTDDADQMRRFYGGNGIDVTVPGQISLRPKLAAVSSSAALVSCTAKAGFGSDFHAASATKMFSVTNAGVVTDHGVHGLGAAPNTFGIAHDSAIVFISTSTAGTVGVRSWDGAAFATFSATPADTLLFHNNSLYGARSDTGLLNVYSTAGVATAVGTWKRADGSAPSITFQRMVSVGGVLYLALKSQELSQVWKYDGTGVSKIADLPAAFTPYDMEVLNGVVYVTGYQRRGVSALMPTIYYISGSTIGLQWKSGTYSTSNSNLPAIAALETGLVWNDDTSGKLIYFDQTTGGTHPIASYTATSTSAKMAGSVTSVLFTNGATTSYLYPDTTVQTTATLQTSQIDFDSSLTKLFRGVIVDWTAASDGDGGSVDIAYQLNGVGGTYTSLQSSAAAGTEYAFGASIKGRSISIQVTLNKGTSTNGPVVTRIYVRAAPIEPPYKYRTYNLDLTSTPTHPTRLQDDTDHPLSGYEQAVNLQAAITSTTPITVTDKFGTFTGICEPAQSSILEIHSEGSGPTKPGQFLVTLVVREV